MKVKRMVLGAASVVALVTGLSVMPAYGQPTYVPNAVCVHSHSIAIDVMSYRQSGEKIEVPQSLVQSDIGYALVEAAYAEPILEDAEARAARPLTFADEMFKMCDDVLGGVYGIAL